MAAAATIANYSFRTGWPSIVRATSIIGDVGNSRIRKISNGIITTVAGSGTVGSSGDGGAATSAQLLGSQRRGGGRAGKPLHRGLRQQPRPEGFREPESSRTSRVPELRAFPATMGSQPVHSSHSRIRGSGRRRQCLHLRKPTITASGKFPRAGVITTFAGTGAGGLFGGRRTRRQCPADNPEGVAVDDRAT